MTLTEEEVAAFNKAFDRIGIDAGQGKTYLNEYKYEQSLANFREVQIIVDDIITIIKAQIK